MKVLVVEDDENKRAEVRAFLETLPTDLELCEARSFQSALKWLRTTRFDRVVLDMTMPSFDISATERGGRPQAYGGRELLRLMKRRAIPTPVVVLTQFDRFGEGENLQTLEELDRQLREEHEPTYQGAVYYDVADDAWRTEVAQFILLGEIQE